MSKIAVDLDNCLNNLTESLLELYNVDAGDNLTLNDIKEYMIETFVKPDWKKRIKYYFMDNLVWDRVVPIVHSQDVIKKLIEDGHDVYVATSSHLYDMPSKYNWLRRKFPFIKKENIITISNKQLLQVDYLIDDYIQNLRGGAYKKIVLDYPWNRKIDDVKEELIRVKDWNEIYNYITYNVSNSFRCQKDKTDGRCLYCDYGYDDDGAIYCKLKR